MTFFHPARRQRAAGFLLLAVAAALARAAEPASQLTVGTVDFAGRAARDHWHVFGADRKSELESLNRELREATQQYDVATNAGAKVAALDRVRAATGRLQTLVTQHPALLRVDLTAAQPGFSAAGPIGMASSSGTLLLEVQSGGEGHRFATAARDLAELPRGSNPTTVIIEAGASGRTHALVGLENLPVGRTTLLVEIRRAGQGAMRLPLEVTAPAPGRLQLAVVSDDDGKPVPSMVRLTSRRDGRTRGPANAVDLVPLFDSNGFVTNERTNYLPGPWKGGFWCMPGPVDMMLPPGDWEIAVGRGFEHTSVFETVTVRTGDVVEKTIRPRRWTDMSRRGWWSADDHVHGRLTSDEDARRLMAWAQAEDVHLTNLVLMGDIYRTYFQQRGFGPEFRVQEGDFVLAPGQESPRTREMGHVLTMNIKQPVHDPDDYYLYDLALDRLHAQGALTGYAHAATGMFEVHRDMTLNVPTRKIDFFEIHQFNNLGTDLYYEFLNLGCKVTASGGSDLPWGGTIGETRVYAHLGRQPFSADAWFEAFARGRTFTTTGPMIEFTVNDALPGEELQTNAGQQLRVRARAWADPNSTLPVRLEIVRHGEVIRSAVSAAPRRESVELDFTVEAADGFWIAARAYTGSGTSAHTTPVYVVRGGLRFWKYGALDELIEKRLASLAQIESVVADVQGQDRGIRLAADRNRKQLSLQGPKLLERVAAARKRYAELREVADAERSRRRTPQTAGAGPDSATWKLATEQNFPVADEYPRWKLEGSAAVSVTMFRTLLVETRRSHIEGADTTSSTIWFDQPASGDVRIEFDARADTESRCSFFFNARPRDGSGTILDGKRPHARGEDYQNERIELYALEILRSGAKAVALKYLGGGASTTLATAPSPFIGDPEKIHHFDVRVQGAHVTVLVDGQPLFDVVDEARKERPLAGGYLGFHNERPGGMSFDSVRVYQRR